MIRYLKGAVRSMNRTFNTRLHGCVFPCFLLFLLFRSTPAECGELRGRIEAPPGTDFSSIFVYYHEFPVSEVENDPHQPAARFDVDENGLFSAHVTTPTLGATLEIVGEGVRRARFAWPRELTVPGPGAAHPPRGVFALEAGGAADLTVVQAGSNAPLAGALVGPISPDASVVVSALADKTYPFFEQTGRGGRIHVQGLVPDVPYSVMVWAPGHRRRVVSLRSEASVQVVLEPGGVAVSGEVRGHATARPWGGVLVALSGGPQGFYILRRTDEAGRFAFEGLEPGRYSLQPIAPGRGVVEPTHVEVGPGGLSGVWLSYPEGIVVSGRAVNSETGEGVSGVRLTLCGKSVESGQDGGFEFPRLLGPWPATLQVEHAAFDFLEETMAAEGRYPIEGQSLEDVDGLIVPLRLRRWLEVIREDWQPGAPPAALELWGPLERDGFDVERWQIAGRRTLKPLLSAGTRLALLRTAAGDVSILTPIVTGPQDTTSTLRLELGPEARLEGSLTFEEGPPPPRFSVEVWSDADGRAPRPVLLRTAAPDADGRFTLSALPPGEVRIVLRRPDDGPPWLETRLSLERGQTAELHHTLTRGLVLAGRVLDSAGEARSGVALTAYGHDPQGRPMRLETVSGEGGTFRLEGWGGPALDELRARHPDFTDSAQQNIALPDEDFEFRLQPRAAITAVLETAEMDVGAAARAWLMQGVEQVAPDGTVFLGFTAVSRRDFDESHQVRFAPESAGRYRVAASAGGQWDVSPDISWDPAGPAQSVTLAPGRRGSLVIVLEGVDAEQAAALQFELIPASWPEAALAAYSSPAPQVEGTIVRFDDLIAGLYRLRVVGADGAEHWIYDLDVQRDNETRRTVSLRRAMRRIEGTVMLGGPDPRPAAGARVQAFINVPEAAAFAETTTDARGHFAFEDVDAARPVVVKAELNRLSATADVAPAAPADAEAATVKIVLSPPARVRLIAPAELMAAMDEQPDRPIILMQIEGGGRAVTLNRAQLEEEQSLVPGRWRVAWGEATLGDIEVPNEWDSVVRITLPAEPAPAP
ncbi:MAG: hypothetical protein Kow0059_17190 [Candidatus Sumerlaeia bacterium]